MGGPITLARLRARWLLTASTNAAASPRSYPLLRGSERPSSQASQPRQTVNHPPGSASAALWLALPSEGATTFVDPGFFEEIVVSGLNSPISVEFLPDGRILVAEVSGVVEMIDGGTINPTPFIDISDEVNGVADRGLLGLAAHPDFPTTPYVYLLFTYDPPETSGQSGNAGPDGAGHRALRLIRVTADIATGYATAVSGSDVILMGTASTAANIGDLSLAMNDTSDITCAPSGTPVEDCIPADGESHTIGSVRFGIDGMLYVGNGDASSYTFVDSRALRSLDLDSMAGKIFRIDPITGQGLSDNPFWDGDADSNRSKVFNYGLRNPFRFTIDPYSGYPWIGDVGANTWEEINLGSGGDFGWPCYEGGSGSSIQQPGYAALSECVSYYGSNSAIAATYAWDHAGSGSAALAGPVNTYSNYPAELDDALFIGDYVKGWIRYIPTDGAGNVLLDGGGDPIVNVFASGIFAMVDLAMGTDGNLHYVNFLTGELVRVKYDNFADPPPVRYEYYEGEWNVLPDFDSETVLATGFIAAFDTAPRLIEDDFGFRFRACIESPIAGSYTFYTTSDDGSQLLIDDVLIVDNDGQHGAIEVSASITLGVATTPIEVRYFDTGGADSLAVEWSGPSLPRQPIPTSALVGCNAVLAATPTSVTFGSVDTGSSSNSSVSVQHAGDISQPDLKITALAITGSADFAHSASLPITLSPGESTLLPISFTPTSVGPIAADLDVTHSGTNDPLTVPLSGTGTNYPPVVTIVSPLAGTTVQIGETLTFSGTGTDVEDGSLTGSSLVWTGSLIHAGHVHPGAASSTGTSGTYEMPDHGDDIYLELCLTGTDSLGSGTTTCVDVSYEEIIVTFTSSPSGLELTYNGVNQTTPFDVTSYANALRSISAPVTQGEWSFEAWDHGGGAAQTLNLGISDLTLTAKYLPLFTVEVGDQEQNVGVDVNVSPAVEYLGSGQLSYSATGLPAGLEIDSQTGSVSGVPIDPGVSQVQIEASDSTRTASTTFSWLILLPDPGFTDVDENHVFADDVAWLKAMGITIGCGPTTFCPHATVRRDQLATMLSNTLGLADGATIDAFTDDNGNIHEPNINRIAHANITKGCTATTFCPTLPIARDQLASMLANAFGFIDGGTIDAFTDDNGNIHEPNINRIAHANITKGCTAITFCPTDAVTRGQLAALLRQALLNSS